MFEGLNGMLRLHKSLNHKRSSERLLRRERTVQIGREERARSVSRRMAHGDLTKQKRTEHGKGRPEGRAGSTGHFLSFLTAPSSFPTGFCPQKSPAHSYDDHHYYKAQLLSHFAQKPTISQTEFRLLSNT